MLLALLPLGLAAPVSAATIYTFSFGSAASGHFITDGASADPGFELITSMTLDFVQTRDDSPCTPVRSRPRTSSPARPTIRVTSAFINHYAGNTYDDIGSLFLRGPAFSSVSFTGLAFSDYGSLDGYFNGSTRQHLASGGLFVRPGVPTGRRLSPSQPRSCFSAAVCSARDSRGSDARNNRFDRP